MFLEFIDPIGKAIGEEWSLNITLGSIFLRIFLAVLLAAIIGCERSTKRHAAGLRTFILVSMTACVAMLLDRYIAETQGFGLYLLSAGIVIAGAIISSNTTLYTSRSQIKGLTTSVALWGSGIIGLSIGAGLYTLTIIVFVALLLSLSIFPAFEIFLKNRSNYFEIHLELKNASYLKDFVTTIRDLGMKIDSIESNHAYLNSGLSCYSIAISIKREELKKYKSHAEIIEALKSLEYVYHIEEMN